MWARDECSDACLPPVRVTPPPDLCMSHCGDAFKAHRLARHNIKPQTVRCRLLYLLRQECRPCTHIPAAQAHHALGQLSADSRDAANGRDPSRQEEDAWRSLKQFARDALDQYGPPGAKLGGGASQLLPAAEVPPPAGDWCVSGVAVLEAFKTANNRSAEFDQCLSVFNIRLRLCRAGFRVVHVVMQCTSEA